MGHTKRTLFQSGTILAACLVGMSMPAGRIQAAETSEKTLARFTVTDTVDPSNGGTRKVLVINGRRLSGNILIRHRGQVIVVNNEQWLPRPSDNPSAEGSSRPAYDALNEADSIASLKIPFVAKRAVRGKPILGIVNDFYRLKQTTGNRALAAYLDGHAGRGGDPKVHAKAQIDTTIAKADNQGPYAPRFTGNSVALYFPGDGWNEFSRLAEGTRMPGGPVSEAEARSRSEDLARSFSNPRLDVVAVLEDAEMIFRGGEQAVMAAKQLDILFGPDSAAIDALLARTAQDNVDGLPGFMLHNLRAEMLRKGSAR